MNRLQRALAAGHRMRQPRPRPRPRPRSPEAGFVLLNALVLVLALAAAAVFMLSRAETVRLRAEAAQDAAQLTLYLDAFEALGMEVLARDGAGGASVDHRGESWAVDLPAVPLDRGAVAGRIEDMQGRFNLNRLANPADEFARAAFDRLARRLGVAPQRVEQIVAYVSPGGPDNARAYARADPAMAPVGGALLMREQLRLIPGLSAQDYARLAPHVTVIPYGMTLNVNTASPEVLASLFDSTNAAGLAALVQMAKQEPFTSTEAFFNELLKIVPAEELDTLPDGFFGVGSSWFALEIEAELDARHASRRSVINRLPLPQAPVVAYRLDNWM